MDLLAVHSFLVMLCWCTYQYVNNRIYYEYWNTILPLRVIAEMIAEVSGLRGRLPYLSIKKYEAEHDIERIIFI